MFILLSRTEETLLAFRAFETPVDVDGYDNLFNLWPFTPVSYILRPDIVACSGPNETEFF